MAPHKKPTPEELQAGIDKAAADLETDLATETPEEKAARELPDPNLPVEEEPVVVPEPDEEEVETPEEKPPTEEEPEYKKKFVESSREAIVLAAKNKKLTSAVEEAQKIPEPTDEEMTKEYSDWDIMDDTQRKLAKDNLLNKKRLEFISNAAMAGRDVEEWMKKVDTFIDNPQTMIDHPELEGKEDDFKIFAGKESRRGLEFDDLILAFMGSTAKERIKNKGKMFETGKGGPNTKPKGSNDGKISQEQAAVLQKVDYKKWTQYLKAGKIRGL